MTQLAPVLVAAASTALALPIVLAVLRRIGLEDHPTERSSHAHVAFRGLGIACIVGWMAATPFLSDAPSGLQFALLVGPVLIGCVGLADDLRGGLPPWGRVATTAVIAGGVGFGIAQATGVAAVVWVPLGLVWVASFTNAFNFMDGIDGISATTVVIAGSAYAWIADDIGATVLVEAGLVLAASAAVFGMINILGAGRFLGDAGSYFFGAALATLALTLFLSGASAAAAAGPLVIYVADTTTTLIRRAHRGERLTEAHRQHVYQRLVDGGLSHATTSMAVGGAMIVTSAVGWWSIGRSTSAQSTGVVAILLVAAVYLAAPHMLFSQQRRSERSLRISRISGLAIDAGMGSNLAEEGRDADAWLS